VAAVSLGVGAIPAGAMAAHDRDGGGHGGGHFGDGAPGGGRGISGGPSFFGRGMPGGNPLVNRGVPGQPFVRAAVLQSAGDCGVRAAGPLADCSLAITVSPVMC
jgi:hypothetical protein